MPKNSIARTLLQPVKTISRSRLGPAHLCYILRVSILYRAVLIVLVALAVAVVFSAFFWVFFTYLRGII